MERIASFEVDHDKIVRGMYISRVDGDIVTYDFDSETDGCVTVRDRDTMEQVRIPISEVKAYIEKSLEF